MDIHRLLTRMWARRSREAQVHAANNYTLSYAVSTRTGSCYVGWNGPYSQVGTGQPADTARRQERWQEATGHPLYGVYELGRVCAEASALSVALAHGEQLGHLIFFATNARGEPFQPCGQCQGWIYPQARGCLKSQGGAWFIQVYGDALTAEEEHQLERAAEDGTIEEEDLSWFQDSVEVRSS